MVDSLDVALAKIDPESDEYIPLDSANILQLVKVNFFGDYLIVIDLEIE